MSASDIIALVFSSTAFVISLINFFWNSSQYKLWLISKAKRLLFLRYYREDDLNVGMSKRKRKEHGFNEITYSDFDNIIWYNVEKFNQCVEYLSDQLESTFKEEDSIFNLWDYTKWFWFFHKIKKALVAVKTNLKKTDYFSFKPIKGKVIERFKKTYLDPDFYIVPLLTYSEKDLLRVLDNLEIRHIIEGGRFINDNLTFGYDIQVLSPQYNAKSFIHFEGNEGLIRSSLLELYSYKRVKHSKNNIYPWYKIPYNDLVDKAFEVGFELMPNANWSWEVVTSETRGKYFENKNIAFVKCKRHKNGDAILCFDNRKFENNMSYLFFNLRHDNFDYKCQEIYIPGYALNGNLSSENKLLNTDESYLYMSDPIKKDKEQKDDWSNYGQVSKKTYKRLKKMKKEVRYNRERFTWWLDKIIYLRSTLKDKGTSFYKFEVKAK